MTVQTIRADSLRAHLEYEPRELKFGTSGRRGEVIHLTQLEIYINARAELDYLLLLPRSEGGIAAGEEFFYAFDLRPSSTRLAAEANGRGDIAQAIERAIRDAGLQPVNLGAIPTPALTAYAIERGRGSIMVTGSHIPFDRNGYKANTSRGELLKKDETPIDERVGQVRERLYLQPFAESLFDARGMFKSGSRSLMPETDAARKAYIRRYADFFAGENLRGKRLLVYQHSAVGRDLLVEILEQFGAEAIPVGRSETFVPIDTENIDDALLATIQAFVDEAAAKYGAVEAVISADGDTDRPLILGVEPVTGKARFFGGDLVGMVVAEMLGADAVVVPISCNDAIDRGSLKGRLEPKTRIGSPFVIEGMERARANGKQAVCGWEANGGFLVGSDIVRNGRVLKALPTRDAVLPILGVLFAAQARNVPLTELFSALPRRFSKAALLRRFPRPVSLAIVGRFSTENERISDVVFEQGDVSLLNECGEQIAGDATAAATFEAVRDDVCGFFRPEDGFSSVARINYRDGVRFTFSNGDVAHIRPSGNADELRIYAVADTQARADEIARLGVAEPDGILRRLERAVAER